MIKTVMVFFGGLVFIVMALMLTSMPQVSDVEAHETLVSADGCSMHEVALDEGYGITRKVSERVCASRD